MEIYNPRKDRGDRLRRGRHDSLPPPRAGGGTKVLLWIGWIAVVALVLLSVFGDAGILQVVRQAEKRRQAEAEVASLRAEIADLRKEVGRLRTSREFVRGVARDGGFVRDNEVVILLDNVPAPPDPSKGRGATPPGGTVGSTRRR
jgi:cell division protein FtsB